MGPARKSHARVGTAQLVGPGPIADLTLWTRFPEFPRKSAVLTLILRFSATLVQPVTRACTIPRMLV